MGGVFLLDHSNPLSISHVSLLLLLSLHFRVTFAAVERLSLVRFQYKFWLRTIKTVDGSTSPFLTAHTDL
jgi:hypothetical protein